MKKNKKPEVLYHFTNLVSLHGILKTRYLKLTTSNFDLANLDLHPVVWLTSSPCPDNMGLLFRDDMPDDLNKTYIRFTIRKKPYMKLWLEWCDEKGMDEELKEILIATANAEETHKTWYVSPQIIPNNDFLVIENLKTNKILMEY